MDEFLAQKTFAVIGVSDNLAKYGHKVYDFLKRRPNTTVYGVNPKLDALNGETIYPTLASLPTIPDVVSIIVPPKIGVGIVDEASKLGIQRLWFQPGAESEEALNKCHDAGIKVLANTCILLT